MTLLMILIGLAILTLGRQLFWLFVGGVGFALGLRLVPQFLSGQPEVVFIIAVIVGLIGAALAVLVKRVAIGLAGFIAGGLLALSLLDTFGWQIGSIWLPFLGGGVIGAILMAFLFDVALIGLSALTGAALIVRVLALNPQISALLFVILCLIGIGFQAYLWQRK